MFETGRVPPSKNPNFLPKRIAMGLTEAYEDTENIAGMQAAAMEVSQLDEASILELLEDTGVRFELRLAAGEYLGVIGDPRLKESPVMVDILGQKVTVGSTEQDVLGAYQDWMNFAVQLDWLRKEIPRHEVSIKSFRIGKFPVTNQEYREFLLDETGSEIPTSWVNGVYPRHRSNHPVYTISVESALAYSDWLTAKTGRVFRLPTEAEWEFAASGPNNNQFPWGEYFDPMKLNSAHCGPITSTPVGIFPDGASYFGCLDMAGNIEEYVSDLYFPYEGGPTLPLDDLQKSNPGGNVAKGGSFTRFGDLARCARRHGQYKSELYPMGFRLAEDI